MSTDKSKRPRFITTLLASVDAPGKCWNWAGYVAPSGYPFCGSEPAYRRAWRAIVGPIPVGLELDHLCKNPRCVNPAHLEPVTPRTNNMRSGSPASVNAKRTCCVNGHEFNAENTTIIVRPNKGTPERKCRVCNRIRQRAYNAAATAERTRPRQPSDGT